MSSLTIGVRPCSEAIIIAFSPAALVASRSVRLSSMSRRATSTDFSRIAITSSGLPFSSVEFGSTPALSAWAMDFVSLKTTALTRALLEVAAVAHAVRQSTLSNIQARIIENLRIGSSCR